MIFELNPQAEHILILGAGASADYGLPVWVNLGFLIQERINEDKDDSYKYKKEILNWVNKVGKNKKYSTIDECIQKESISKEHHSNGHEIENQIFLVIRDILNETYIEPEEGWIRILNEKVLFNQELSFGHKIAFINYNYDYVLDKNFLNFSFLPEKQKRLNHKESLYILSQTVVGSLYPHGNLFSREELKGASHVYRYLDTMKSSEKEYIDAVSCYESRHHIVQKANRVSRIKLYLLGIGGGLEINLNNITFANPISEIHVTVKDISIKDKVVSFLSKKYRIPSADIKIYSTCKELVEKCF